MPDKSSKKAMTEMVRRHAAGKPGPPNFPTPHAQATTKPGKQSGGGKITEDDPRWNPKKDGNKRGQKKAAAIKRQRKFQNDHLYGSGPDWNRDNRRSI